MKRIASAIIEVSGENLLVREPGEDHYKNVGGAVNGGETLEDALIREFSEEISGARIRSMAYSHTEISESRSGQYEVNYFRVEIDGSPSPGKDIAEVRLFEKDFAK